MTTAQISDEFVRQFSSRLARLGDPVLREVLDPLVIDALAFANSNTNINNINGGQTVVGCVESQLLRAPKNQKYALCVLIDALCKARSMFPFKVYFTQNLERIFSHAYHEADEVGKTKMLRLLSIWKKASLFDSLVLERIRARCDPDYEGEPVDSLPQPGLAKPPARWEPSSVIPNVTPVYSSFIPPLQPTLPQPQQQEQLIFQRATELLRNMYVQMQAQVHQQVPLNEIYRMNPNLYQ
jgi:hypothetical protein